MRVLIITIRSISLCNNFKIISIIAIRIRDIQERNLNIWEILFKWQRCSYTFKEIVRREPLTLLPLWYNEPNIMLEFCACIYLNVPHCYLGSDSRSRFHIRGWMTIEKWKTP